MKILENGYKIARFMVGLLFLTLFFPALGQFSMILFFLDDFPVFFFHWNMKNSYWVRISYDGNPEKWPVFMVGPSFSTLFYPALGQLSIILFFCDEFRGF